ncbi:hypothetical protein PCC7418_3040 [Halothece sp. PCC 7418]|nr:hypothetical protein PCC7418_3040 [Halothece sp. PCC 7418]
MQKQRLSMRVEVSRIEKLRLYARYKRKTMTQLVEDWIDTLEMPNYKDTEG